MNKLRYFLMLILLSSLSSLSFAQNNLSEFMSARDLLNNESSSNISLQNNRLTTANVYGLYVRQYAYVLPGQSCSNATVIYSTTNNIAAGAFVLPTTIASKKRAALGSNFLYNMIYQSIYYENIIIPSSPPGCALPGCTWGSDTTQYNWCIYLGALAPVSNSSSYTANVPPSTDAPSSSNLYNYDLVTNYSYLGPISCDDRTLTCTSPSQQIQAFS